MFTVHVCEQLNVNNQLLLKMQIFIRKVFVVLIKMNEVRKARNHLNLLNEGRKLLNLLKNDTLLKCALRALFFLNLILCIILLKIKKK